MPPESHQPPDQPPYVIVMNDGTRHVFEPFVPKAVNQLKVNLGTAADYEGIWACVNDEGAAMLADRARHSGQWIPLTLRNHALCWVGLPSWGMVLPVRITPGDGRMLVDLSLINFDATMEANGGSPPFLRDPTQEA